MLISDIFPFLKLKRKKHYQKFHPKSNNDFKTLKVLKKSIIRVAYIELKLKMVSFWRQWSYPFGQRYHW